MPGVTTAELAYCMTLPPKRAVSYLKSKGYKITWDWEDMWQEAHARAFTVAKVTRLDILEDIRSRLQQALDEGKTDRWFRQQLEPELQRKGWWGPRDTTDPVTGEPVTIQQGSPWRLDTIFAPICRYSTAPDAGPNRWRTSTTGRTGCTPVSTTATPAKAIWSCTVWCCAYDDPFWQAFYPPNGWRCRCGVIALSAAGSSAPVA